MPTYGRTFTLSNTNNYKVNSPASGGGKAGEYTKEGGFLAYYEVIIIKKYCFVYQCKWLQWFNWSFFEEQCLKS